uniref:Putative ste20-like serine/threonine protein kinase n=1 Tax=Lutzomyia longipalpis TaxID=7200 RepID=A0A7G3B239_LUTLO
MFGFNPNDYEIRKELATCCNGIASVYLAKHTSGQLVALKKFRMDRAKEESAYIRDEILTMRQFHHPNILSFFTSFVDNFDVFVIAPFMPYGSCRDTMTNSCRTGFPEIIVVLILRDVLHGVEYLHKKGFIHRAIRASHILMNHERAVLTGFRQAITLLSHGERVRSLHNLPANSTKGLNWLAPEVLEQDLLGYSEKSDVYSVGISTQPTDRPNVSQLFNHPVFKQTKHTNLSEQLTNFGIHPVDYSQHCDENLKLVQDLSDMNLSAGSAFEWDF